MKHAEKTKSLEDHCYDYLSTLPVVIFGRSWDITNERSKQEAAKWLADHIHKLMRMQ